MPQLEDTLEAVDMLVKMQIDARWAEPDGPGVGIRRPPDAGFSRQIGEMSETKVESTDAGHGWLGSCRMLSRLLTSVGRPGFGER